MALETIDAAAKRGVLAVQEYALLSGRALGNLFRRPFYRDDIFMQADIIGVGSLPIVILTGFFLGGVLALQSAATLSQFGAAAFTGQLVSFSMIKEIGPVVTALMVSGRNASGMASELGSIVATEQIDGIRAPIGCFYGRKTRGGTQGVGRSTTQAVVWSSILIIATDFMISRTMIGIFGR